MSVATPAMVRRGLMSAEAERNHAEACLRGSGLPLEEAIAHRVAQHAARCAWAEVEYAAWRAGNSVGLIHRPERRADMIRLLDAAYAADEAERQAHITLTTAENRQVAR